MLVCVWWLHQKHDNANYDQFFPNFDKAYKTVQQGSVPNFNLFGPMKTELQVKEVGEFSITLYGKWAGGHTFSHQHGCRNTNLWRLSELLTAVTLCLFQHTLTLDGYYQTIVFIFFFCREEDSFK